MNKLFQIGKQLEAISDTPELDARLLLSAVTQKDHSYLLAHPEYVLDEKQIAALDALVLRRQQGEPIAYILGGCSFWSLDLLVTPDVLIPRPETECLVEWILDHVASDLSLKVADLGTGSGCIALALACERAHWKIHAVDRSEAALHVAKHNALKNKCENVAFFLGSWCQALPEHDYDLIVSNPPYIAEGDEHLEALQYEPEGALVSGRSGLLDIQLIAEQALRYLKPGGTVLVEHGYDQGDPVLACFSALGYIDLENHCDLANTPRFVKGVKP